MDEAAEDGDAQPERIELAAARGCAAVGVKTEAEQHEGDGDGPPIGSHEPAEADDEDGNCGQLGVEILEDFDEVGKDEGDQDEDGDGADDGEEGRVNHGGEGFAAEFLVLFAEGDDAPEDFVEHTAGLARFDEVGVHGREDVGMAFEGLGETAALLDRRVEIVDDVAQLGIGGLIAQGGECAEDGHAGLQQVGELAEEPVAILKADAGKGDLYRGAGLDLRKLLDGDREKAHVAELGDDGALVFGLHDARGDAFAAALHFVLELRHALTRRPGRCRR